jgi:hypothetical protein
MLLLAASAFFHQSCLAETPQEKLAHCKELLESKWKSVQFGMLYDGGDSYFEGPFCLVQRLPDGRFLLSVSQRANPRGMFIATRYLEEKEAYEILWAVFAVCEEAATEKSYKERVQELPENARQEISKKLRFGIAEQRIELTVATTSATRAFVKSFDDAKPNFEKFEGMLEKLLPAKPK